MKIKKALCLVLTAVMTATAMPAFADTPKIGGLMPSAGSTNKSGTDDFFAQISEMEYNAENVRLAVAALGVSEDMTYAFKSLLKDDSLVYNEMSSNVLLEVLAELGVKDMPGFAGFLKTYTTSWQVNPISILDPQDAEEPPTGTFNRTTLSIYAGNNTSSSSFKVEGANSPGDTDFSGNVSNNTIPEGGIKITPAPGYRLVSVTTDAESYYIKQNLGDSNALEDKFDDHSFYGDFNNFLLLDQFKSDGASKGITIKKSDLTNTIKTKNLQKNDLVIIPKFSTSGRGSTKSINGQFSITVTTVPLDKGQITIEKDVSGGNAIDMAEMYQFDGRDYRNMPLLQQAINDYIAEDNIKVGSTITFSYNTDYIESVTVPDALKVGDSNTSDNGTVSFKVPDSTSTDNKIQIKFKKMSETVTLSAGGAGGSEDENIVYTFKGETYVGLSQLQTAINAFIGSATPVGTSLSFSYQGDSITNIVGSQEGGTYNAVAKTFVFTTTAESNTITVTFASKSTAVTVSKGTGNDPGNITYTLNNEHYNSIDSLSSALSDYVTNLNVGSRVSFTYTDPSGVITGITGSENLQGFSHTANLHTVAFTTSTNESQTISINFKSLSQGVKVTSSGTEPKEANEITYTLNGSQYKTVSALSAALEEYTKTLYTGSVVSFTVSDPTSSISGITGSEGLTNFSYNGGTVSFTINSESEQTVTVAFNTKSAVVTVEKGTGTAPTGVNTVTYTLNGVVYNSIDNLNNQLKSYLPTLNAGTQVTITVSDPSSAISSIEESNLTGFNYSGGTITFTTSDDSDQKITVNFKVLSGGLTYTGSHITSVKVTGPNGSDLGTFNNSSALDTFIKTLYEGTAVNLTFNLDSGYSITKATGGGMLVGGNAVNNISLTSAPIVLTLTVENSDPVVLLSKMSSDIPESYGDKLAVFVAYVNNIEELSDAALANAQLTISANASSSNNENPVNGSITVPVGKKNSGVNVEGDGAEGKDQGNKNYAGIAFEKKNETLNYNYTYNVSATLDYNNNNSSKNATSQSVSFSKE